MLFFLWLTYLFWLLSESGLSLIYVLSFHSSIFFVHSSFIFIVHITCFSLWIRSFPYSTTCLPLPSSFIHSLSVCKLNTEKNHLNQLLNNLRRRLDYFLLKWKPNTCTCIFLSERISGLLLTSKVWRQQFVSNNNRNKQHISKKHSLTTEHRAKQNTLALWIEFWKISSYKFHPNIHT